MTGHEEFKKLQNQVSLAKTTSLAKNMLKIGSRVHFTKLKGIIPFNFVYLRS